MSSSKQLHDCETSTPYRAYGRAISHCWENELGEFWVSNGEYTSQVWFCPYCGKKAPVQEKKKEAEKQEKEEGKKID